MDPVLVWRRLLAEFVGTALLVTAVVGSGIMATTLSPDDVGLADWLLGRSFGTGLTARQLGGYLVAQTGGAIAGAILANLMFALPAVSRSTKDRSGPHLWLGEVVATAGLVLLVFAVARSGRSAAVGAYIGAAYWFTSSTSFANPAVTIGRAFTDTFAGISSGSVPGFVVAQIVGGTLGAALLAAVYPHPGRAADRVVVEHPARRTRHAERPPRCACAGSAAVTPASALAYGPGNWPRTLQLATMTWQQAVVAAPGG